MKVVLSSSGRVALLVSVFNVALIGNLAVWTCACATTSASTTSATSPDAVRCTREPVGAWEHIPSPYGGEHKHSENGKPTRMSIMIDVSPIEKSGAQGSIIVLDATDHLGGMWRDFVFLPRDAPDYKPLERIVRCLKGAMERRYEEWKAFVPFNYQPAPTGKKGGK